MGRMTLKHRPQSALAAVDIYVKVKLGDFDSAGTVPGLGITEPTDQVIKFASILPLGTPGYRAPEVAMYGDLSSV